MYYIYKMIHKPTGRVYIGQRKCPKGKTPDTDTAYNGSGKIWRAIWRKHMDECCKVILDTAPSKTAIDDLERKYISHYKGVMGEYCVNITPGGEGFGSGDEHPRPMKGKNFSEEHRRKLSEAGKNKHHTEETRRKQSASHKGAKNPMFGKHLSDETRAKLSEAKKGKHHSAETRAKMSAARKAYWKNRKGDIA